MTTHDQQDTIPTWYKPQPPSPLTVYDKQVITDIQRTLMCPQTGEWDNSTISHIKGLQQLFGINPTGVIDQATAVQIERLRSRFAV
jgi:hypothetical protein